LLPGRAKATTISDDDGLKSAHFFTFGISAPSPLANAPVATLLDRGLSAQTGGDTLAIRPRVRPRQCSTVKREIADAFTRLDRAADLRDPCALPPAQGREDQHGGPGHHQRGGLGHGTAPASTAGGDEYIWVVDEVVDPDGTIRQVWLLHAIQKEGAECRVIRIVVELDLSDGVPPTVTFWLNAKGWIKG
jgi:hypothetical protein